ncbi:hypothetical protein ACTXT7_015097 [Hymenolepis weldensis]
MASLNPSVIFWNEEEIMPRSILLISSGAVGDRLLFWQSTISPQNYFQHDLSESRLQMSLKTLPSGTIRHGQHPATYGPGVHIDKPPQMPIITRKHRQINVTDGSRMNACGIFCPSPAGGVIGTPASSLVIGSPHQSTTSTPTGSGINADVAKSRPTAQRHSASVAIAAGNVSSPATPGAVSGTVGGVSGATGPGSGISVVAPTEMIVEDVPVSSLLSLLHPSTNELQHKIYVKVSFLFV